MATYIHYQRQLAKLRETRDKQIVSLRNKGLTLRAIGKLLGISYERVRQVYDDRAR